MGIREAGAITSLVPAASEQNTRLCLLHKEGQSSCRSTSETESRDTVLAELLVATRVLQKVMDHVTVLVSVRLWCLLMTSLDGTGATTFQSLGGTGSRTVISQEKTIQARSTIECAVLCRRFPYCISFAYSNSTCRLHPATSTDLENRQPSNTRDQTVAVFTEKNPSCSGIPLDASLKAVTIQRSLWSVQANVTCHDDYFPSTLQVTCAADGKWSDVQCLKRVWRYPETKASVFPIPGTVTVGWSACIQGIPTANTVFRLEIYDKPGNNILIHTSWRLNPYVSTPYLEVNDFYGVWGSAKLVFSPPLLLRVSQPFDCKLTVNTSGILHIFMDHQFFGDWTLKVPLSSFYYITGSGDVNLTKVEAWCS